MGTAVVGLARPGLATPGSLPPPVPVTGTTPALVIPVLRRTIDIKIRGTVVSESTTYPAAVTVLSGETLPIGIDFKPLIKTGQTPTAPTSLMYDTTDSSPGTPITISGVTLSGNVVTQTITGLTAGHTYRLILGLTAVAGTVWQAGVTLTCPF